MPRKQKITPDLMRADDLIRRINDLERALQARSASPAEVPPLPAAPKGEPATPIRKIQRAERFRRAFTPTPLEAVQDIGHVLLGVPIPLSINGIDLYQRTGPEIIMDVIESRREDPRIRAERQYDRLRDMRAARPGRKFR